MATAVDTREYVALNADVVGYSRLMADDFDATTEAMAEARHLVTEEVERGGGLLVDFAGDSFMALFDDAISAVRTAISITTTLETRQAGVPESRQVRFRMGSDVGDVQESEGQYFGDALNIAARIQAMAPTGGLSVSSNVYEALDEPALRFRAIGQQRLKNIPERVGVFEFKDLPSDGSSSARDTLSLEALTVAILPIHTETVDDQIKALADLIRADLIHRLSRIPQLSVVDAGPDKDKLSRPARYVIESGVFAIGDQARVHAQLIDVTTWNIVKSHKWSTPVSELFALSESIADEIANSIEVDLVIGAPAGLYSDLADPDAIEKIYQGWYHLTSGTKEGWLESLELFDAVATSHPNQPYGFVLGAFANWFGAINGLPENQSETLEKAYEMAEVGASKHDPTGMSSMVLAAVHISRREFAEASELIENVEIHRPTCDATYGLEGSLRRYLGEWRRAVDATDTAMRLTGINKPWYPTIKACSLFMDGQLAEAASVAERVVEYQPNNLEALLVLTATQVELGLDRRARATAALIREHHPAMDVERWLDRNPYKNPAVVERWREALTEAGVLDDD